MRVLQLIDSLDPGGAEKMAVALANELAAVDETESFLCSSRKEGLFRDQISGHVGYIHLAKRSTLDPRALWRLSRFISKNKIEVIHAHSSSFFYGFLMKTFHPSLRLIWHDHYGESEQLEARDFGMLRRCSKSFDGIISVNETLRKWASEHLKCADVSYLKNFVHVFPNNGTTRVQLEGNKKKIICLANFRPQKDHLTLLKAFKCFSERNSSWSLHLVGKDFNNSYSASIFDYLAKNQLSEVYYYGEQFDAHSLLQQADVGVLSSTSEGLPLALLEYGLSGLIVVASDVGAIAEVLSGSGRLFEAAQVDQLAMQFDWVENQQETARMDAERFKEHVNSHYGFRSIQNQLFETYIGES